jgi:KDO2-lipid IV(A) lauroyltransferase
MNEKRKFKSRIEHIAARALLGALSRLPRSLSFAAGRGLGRFVFALGGGRLSRAGWRNLEMAMPETSREERAKILRGCYVNLGRMLGAISRFPRLTKDNIGDLIICEGLDHFEEARSKNKGVILFSGHLGGWELVALAPLLLDQSVHYIVKRQPNESVETLVEEVRARFGNQTIDKSASARQMLNVLKDGGALYMLIDLNMHWHEGVFVDFFGIEASTNTSLARLALRTGASVLPAFWLWDEKLSRYRLKIDPPLVIEETGDEEKDIRHITENFTNIMERYVRDYPEQWWWIHKRWNTPPRGRPNLYS